MNKEIGNILHRLHNLQLSFTWYKHVKCWGVDVKPQLSAGKRRSTKTNYILAHNFQQNSKKENLQKMPHRTKYNTQITDELYCELLLLHTKTPKLIEFITYTF